MHKLDALGLKDHRKVIQASKRLNTLQVYFYAKCTTKMATPVGDNCNGDNCNRHISKTTCLTNSHLMKN